MRLRAATWPLAALLGALPLASAFADSLPPVPVRVGNHEGYSRVVFNLPSRTDYHVTQEGQHVVVQFAGDVMIGAANGVPRNVLTVTSGAGRAEIVVAPGTIVRDWRLGNVVVIDFMDRDAAADKPTTQQTVAAQPPPAKPRPACTPPAAPLRLKPPNRLQPNRRPASHRRPRQRLKPPNRLQPNRRPATRRTPPAGANRSSQTVAGSQPAAPRQAVNRLQPNRRPASHRRPRQRLKPPNRLQPNRRPASHRRPRQRLKPPNRLQPNRRPASHRRPRQRLKPPNRLQPNRRPTSHRRPRQRLKPPRPPPAEAPPAQQPGAPPAPTKLEATNPQHEPVPVPAAPPDATPASTAQPAPAAAVGDTATQSTPGFEAGLVVPSGPQLGVAVFRRGRTALIVFDQPITH